MVLSLIEVPMAGGEACPHFIPLSRGELVGLLCADPTLPPTERPGIHALADLLAAHYHFEYARRFGPLQEAYCTFDPDTDNTVLLSYSASERQTRLNRLTKDMAALLERAGFRHLSRDEVDPALDRVSDWGIRMDVDFSAFDHLALFARGETFQLRRRRRLRNFYRTEEVEVPVFRRLALILKMRDSGRLPESADPHNVFLKLFKDIPRLDVLMLLPGARVQLNLLDRGRIGLPFLSGLLAILWNFLADVLQFFESLLLSPALLWTLFVGGVSYGYKSFYGYLTLKQRYHLTLTRSLYFQNLDSNAGVLSRLLEEAESQECLTALLGWFCLAYCAGQDGWSADELDTVMDLYLDRYADLTVQVESGAAMQRLIALGLVEEIERRWRAVPLAQALAVVHSAWDVRSTLSAQPV